MFNKAKKHWSSTLFGIISIVLVTAVACGAAPGKGKPAGKRKGDAPLAPVSYDPRVSLAPLIEKVAPAVVNIRTTSKAGAGQRPGSFDDLFQWFFGPRGPGMRPMPRQERRQTQRSVGSGFIIDSSGLVVTNHHVARGADEIEVQLTDDRKFKAELVGSDERTDVALLRIKGAKKLPSVSFGDSSKLKVGDHVVAIGNPFGLDHTVTSGIVSAKERVIGAGMYDDFIQTDASINPGNSGGPLFNLSGKVVGINTAINPHGQGIGFAIPSNLAMNIIGSLSDEGVVVRGYLGVAFQPLDDKLSKAFKTNSKSGVVVTNVTEGSPASKGGIQSGDVIIELAGKKLKEPKQLAPLVAKLKPGATISIKVIRNGRPQNLKIKIGKMPDNFGSRPFNEPENKKSKTKLGIHVQPLDTRAKRQLGAQDVEGVVVVSVDSESSTSDALAPGDIITEVNRKKVRSVEEFRTATDKLGAGDDLLLRVYRQASWRYVVIRL